MRNLIAGASGLIFGLGLVVAEMTDPKRVLDFFDVAGAWDPTLGFVMGGAVAVMMLAWPLLGARGSAVYGPAPSAASRTIDARLLGGAALFGAGWGVTGLCPAPAIAALSFGGASSVLFLLGVAIGILATGVIDQERQAA